jgi:hypothetical protein
MRTSSVPAAAFLALSIPFGGGAQTPPNVKTFVDALGSANAAGGIERIDVFRLPKTYESLASAQPEDVEAFWRYKMVIRNPPASQQKLIGTAFAAADVSPSDRASDLRWGIVFYSPRDRRIGSLYFDESGRRGAVDRTPVLFAPGFLPRLKQALHLSMD